MNAKKLTAIMAISSAMLIGGCSDSDSDETSTGSELNADDVDNNDVNDVVNDNADDVVNDDVGDVVDDVVNDDAVTEYNGSWLEACRLNNGNYEVVNYTITSDTYTSITSFYNDAECAIPHSLFPEVTAEFSLVYPGGTTSTSLGEARHVDITLESVLFNSVEPTASQEQQLNANNLYETTYNLVHLSDERLYLGQSTVLLNATSADKRPDTIDLSRFAVRL